ncbi:TPA: ETX/MTX2 family pore-forming toxin [Bacillus thuringiensis]|nr:ETX/MTX2 family pore-forming toxin [Bacillus thuringiensis]
MAITDIEQSAFDIIEGFALKSFPGIIPGSFFNRKIYPYELTNAIAVPVTTSITANPIPKVTSIQVLENDGEAVQNQTAKFSEKSIESVKNTTTEGYKIGAGIKSTTKFKVKVGFLVSGEIEQSLEVSLTGEYNHSSTQETTRTTEKLWEITQPVTVPPYSRITATLVIMEANLKIPMTLSANLRGTKLTSGIVYPFVGIDFQTTNGSVGTDLGADGLYRYGSYSQHGKPESFKSAGPNQSLNLEGHSFTAAGVGLYTIVRFEQTPLSGYSGETKTWYSDQVMLRDGSILTLPNFNAIIGRSDSCSGPIILGSNNSGSNPIIFESDNSDSIPRVLLSGNQKLSY